MLSPAQCLAIYGGSALLAYIETSAYEKDHRLLLSLPLVILSLLTLATTMSAKARGTTAVSFLTAALAVYLQSTHRTTGPIPAILFSLSNCIYYVSYRDYVTSTSSPIILLSIVVSFGAFLHVLQDLIVAIPFLTFLLAVLLASHILLMATSASLCRYGLHGDFDARQASYVRLFGAFLSWLSTALFIFNSFHYHTKTLNVISRVVFYVAHSMLFISNERAF